MIQIATTIEQSKRLLELGLSHESADLYYLRIVGETYNQDTDMVLPITDNNSKVQLGFITEADYPAEDMLPAWSLGTLLKLLPKSSHPKLLRAYATDKWYIDCLQYTTDQFDTPLDAAFNIVCWFLDFGYIK